MPPPIPEDFGDVYSMLTPRAEIDDDDDDEKKNGGAKTQT